MPFELTDRGLSTQTQEEIVADLAARLRARFGQNLKTDLKSFTGQLILFFAELRATDQQTLLGVYQSFDPNGARGRSLDARLNIIGVLRKGETRSTVEGILTFSSGATVSNGHLIRNEDNGSLWELVDGPHESLGAWPEEMAATYRAVEAGPTLANAGTLWTIVTPIAGLDSFTNPVDDAEVGRLVEADGDARRRRNVELYARGKGPLLAIAGRVSKVDGVVDVRVYENTKTYPVDADGIPFKAFNVVVETEPATPGAELQQAIHDAIWLGRGAGGQVYGTDYEGTVVDSEGVERLSAFDVVELVDVVLELDLVTSTSEDPVSPNLETVVAERVIEVAQADYEKTGRDVRALDFKGVVQAMLAAGEITGVDDVVVRMAIDPDSPTVVAKLAVSIRQRADFDSGNLTVAQT